MFELSFDTDNDAFTGDNLHAETVRILEQVIEKLNGEHFDGIIHDVNGNRVGTWNLDEPEDDNAIDWKVINNTSRARVVVLLEGIGTACYDDEPMQDLRECLAESITSGDISIDDCAE